MIDRSEIALSSADARKRIIVALDTDNEDRAYSLAASLRKSVGSFKIGLQLFTAAGPAVVRRFVKEGFRIFLDLKFHDIPNTVASASVEAAKLGVWMFNLHASGGSEMMTAARGEVEEWCSRTSSPRPIMIGVTVLTSADASSMSELNTGLNISDRVSGLADLVFKAGLDGVVASAHEIVPIRQTVRDPKFLTVTPGIRVPTATVDDQKRVTTLRGALTAGADYIVIGRPITASDDPAAAVEKMLEGIEI